MKADVTGRPLNVYAFQEFSALGAAMAGGIAAGVYASADEAIARTAAVRATTTVAPDPATRDAYEQAYRRYVSLYPALAEWFAAG